MTLGDKIRELRRAAGLTQGDLAKMLNTTKQTIGKYEQGIVSNLPLSRIVELAIVRKYTITHEAGKPPVIEVELVGDVTVSGGFITPLPEPWKSIYHNLSKGGNDETQELNGKIPL